MPRRRSTSPTSGPGSSPALDGCPAAGPADLAHRGSRRARRGRLRGGVADRAAWPRRCSWRASRRRRRRVAVELEGVGARRGRRRRRRHRDDAPRRLDRHDERGTAREVDRRAARGAARRRARGTPMRAEPVTPVWQRRPSAYRGPVRRNRDGGEYLMWDYTARRHRGVRRQPPRTSAPRRPDHRRDRSSRQSSARLLPRRSGSDDGPPPRLRDDADVLETDDVGARRTTRRSAEYTIAYLERRVRRTPIEWCPFCGPRLPESLDDEWMRASTRSASTARGDDIPRTMRSTGGGGSGL